MAYVTKWAILKTTIEKVFYGCKDPYIKKVYENILNLMNDMDKDETTKDK